MNPKLEDESLAILFLITSSIFCARNEGRSSTYSGVIGLFNPEGGSDETKLLGELSYWNRVAGFEYGIESAKNKEDLVEGIDIYKRRNHPTILIIAGMRNLDILKEIEGDFQIIVYTSTDDKRVLDNVAREKGIAEDKIEKMEPFRNFCVEMQGFIVRELSQMN